jgi:hypothetical protein
LNLPAPIPVNPVPGSRRLRVYAIDPALALQVETLDTAVATIEIPWNDLEGLGPVGEYIEVIDFDPTTNSFYAPVNLEAPELLAQEGLAPDESDPRFHQQMVYAVCMYTIKSFEEAIGRRVHWGTHVLPKFPGHDSEYDRYVKKLRVYPHALRAKNAYYDPEKKALLFGSFPVKAVQGGAPTSVGNVFTALSFDIIAHETTHAILDGLHRRFTENTNPDVLAFHEAFADIVALFQHFSLSGLLRHQIAQSRGKLDTENLLSQLAVQFGKGTGHYHALRDSLGEMDKDGKWKRKDPKDIDFSRTLEPHARGAILVTAIFEAFLLIYKKRTADLLRIASGGSGILREGAIDTDLVNRLADEAAKTAHQVCRMCIRALDYVPPIDITFGEYLRAILTADYDVIKNDEMGYRVAFMQAFQKWGIEVEGGALWDQLGGLVDAGALWQQVERMPGAQLNWDRAFAIAMAKRVEELWDPLRAHREASQTDRRSNDPFWDRELRAWFPNKNPTPSISESTGYRFDESFAGQGWMSPYTIPREEMHKWSEETAHIIHDWFRVLKAEDATVFESVFGIDPTLKFEVHSARLMNRPSLDRSRAPSLDLVIVITQRLSLDRVTLTETSKGAPGSMVFRGGCTIIFDLEKGKFRYVIRKNIRSKDRPKRQLKHQTGRGMGMYFDSSRQPFKMLHEWGGEM